MLPDHLDLLRSCGRPSLTPDGALAVVAVSRPDLTTDAGVSALWVVPVDGSAARRLTTGPRDSAPAVSPDRHRVAFLRAGSDGPPQLHVTGLHGGEPVRLTDHDLGAGAPRWSPDGTRIAYSARVPEAGRYGTKRPDDDAVVTPDAEPARLITSPRYREDSLGFVRDRRQHLFVVDVPADSPTAGSDLPTEPWEGSAPRQLTDGDVDDVEPSWSPDGSRIAFLSARHDGREQDLRSAAYVVPADAGDGTGATPVAVTGGHLSVSGVAWLPDARLLLTASDLGETGLDFVGRATRLWVTDSPVGTDVAGVSPLTDDATVDVQDGSASLVVAGDRVVVAVLDRGAVRLVAVDPDGPVVDLASATTVLGGPLLAAAHAATPSGDTLVAVVADGSRSGDLAVVADGEPRFLTDVSADLRAAQATRPLTELEVPSADGYPVHGWTVLPDPEVHGPGPYPVLLNVHGGPAAMYGWGLFDEFQVYAGAGYAVVACNPRGSAGYGQDHTRSIRGRMGSVDADDVLAFLDGALAADPRLDAGRVGVMGGSYGGYMTALLTTRTQRFAAAVVERGYLDAASFVGSSDIGWFFPGQYHGDREAMVAQSPMAAVDAVTTPTLVIHSETDWRTPVEQGQRWFTALHAQGVETELLLFPAESHELSRAGRPRHRKQRFEHILDWWHRHLPVGG